MTSDDQELIAVLRQQAAHYTTMSVCAGGGTLHVAADGFRLIARNYENLATKLENDLTRKHPADPKPNTFSRFDIWLLGLIIGATAAASGVAVGMAL